MVFPVPGDPIKMAPTGPDKYKENSKETTDIEGRSQTLYTAPSSMVLKLRVSGFCQPQTHKQMRPRSLRTVLRFTRVNLHTQTTVDAGDIRTWWTMVILITGNPNTPNLSPV